MIEAPDANRDVLLKYVESKTEIAPKPNSAWRFARWPSAVVATYLTSPAASDLPAPPGLKLTSMGLAPGGFLKLRVETERVAQGSEIIHQLYFRLIARRVPPR